MMDLANAPEIGGGITALGIVAWIVYVVFKSMLPTQRNDYLNAIGNARSDFTSALEKQRQDFSQEMEKERELTIAQSDQHRQVIAEQREDFSKTMQIVISSCPQLTDKIGGAGGSRN